MRFIVVLLFMLTAWFADAADWYTADIDIKGSLLDFAQGQRYDSFQLNGIGWVQPSKLGHPNGKMIINGKNHNCDSVGSAIQAGTETVKYYCNLSSTKFIDILMTQATQKERFNEAVTAIRSFYAKSSDKRIFILIGVHGDDTDSWDMSFLEPYHQNFQTDVSSAASELTLFN